MPKLIDLIGKQFGRLTVTRRASNDKNGLSRWCCVCSCGASVIVRGQDLRRGRQVSCGCWKDENTSARDRTHGHSGTRLHRIWKNMKSRCYNPRVKSYKDYGAKGVRLCEEWKDSFSAFYSWAMSHGYQDELTIDRINPAGNYEPNNCRWATRAEQSKNKRANKKEVGEGASDTRPSP